MSMKPRIRVPSPIRAGDVIEVRTLINHVMETGQRRGADGQLIPRDIIHTFTATFDGREVFKADFNSGISANPYLAFNLKAQTSGQLLLTWSADGGAEAVEKVDIVVA